MSMTDPIADLLSRIRNAQIAKHDRLDVPMSKLKLEVVKLLKEEGFVKNFREIEGVPVGTLRIFLRYTQEGVPAISNLERISKPGRRVYRKADEIQPVRNGLGIG
ncbi:MAG TPA: 30S ribosomal protein S8, partial [Thermoanaerobaculia bacterium]